MNTTDLAESYLAFYPLEFIESKIDYAINLLPEPVIYAIPSIQLGADGLTLTGLLLVTNNYFCDVRLQGVTSLNDFDFMAKNTICNYRVKTWTHEVKEEEIIKASFEICEVTLVHGNPDKMTTILAFAGKADERKTWLDNVTQAVPIKLVQGFSRPLT